MSGPWKAAIRWRKKNEWGKTKGTGYKITGKNGLNSDQVLEKCEGQAQHNPINQSQNKWILRRKNFG